MSIRSYAGTLLFETLFDSIQPENIDLVNFADRVFSPQVRVTMEDCGTTLGENTQINWDSQGLTELATNEVLSEDRITQLLNQGSYYADTRSLSTCIAPGGVCRQCYKASRPTLPIPDVGVLVQIHPEYSVAVDTYLWAPPLPLTFKLSKAQGEADNFHVYVKGHLLAPTEYTITDNPPDEGGGATLTLNQDPDPDGNQVYVVIRTTTIIRAPYLQWLADTYSGSMMGMKPISVMKLPVRKQLLDQTVSEGTLSSLIRQASELPMIPEENLAYIEKIADRYERALYVIALHIVYGSVSK